MSPDRSPRPRCAPLRSARPDWRRGLRRVGAAGLLAGSAWGVVPWPACRGEGPTTEEGPASAALEQAREAYRDADDPTGFDRAAAAFAVVAASDADAATRAEAAYFQGESLAASGRYDEAGRAFATSLADPAGPPDAVRARFRAAEMAVLAGDPDMAEPSLRDFLTDHAGSPLAAEARWRLADLLQAGRRAGEALAVIEAGPVPASEAMTAVRLAALAGAGRGEAAAALARATLAAAPGTTLAEHAARTLFEVAGPGTAPIAPASAGADRTLRLVAEVEPSLPPGPYRDHVASLARQIERARDRPMPAAVVRPVAALLPVTWSARAPEPVEPSGGETSDASGEGDRATPESNAPEQSDVQVAESVAAGPEGPGGPDRAPSARRLPEGAAGSDRPPASPPADDEAHALFLEGRRAIAAGRWDHARMRMAEVVALAGAPPGAESLGASARFWTAECDFRAGRTDAAARTLDALASEPGHADAPWLSLAVLRRAQILAAEGRPGEALAVLADLSDRGGEERRPYEADALRGDCLAALGRAAEARAAWERVVASPEGGRTEAAAEAATRIGRSHLDEGRPDEALRALAIVESTGPWPAWQAPALLTRGRCHEAAGAPDEAARTYVELIRRFPGSPAAAEAAAHLRSSSLAGGG